jgi:hypothetical protein
LLRGSAKGEKADGAVRGPIPVQPPVLLRVSATPGLSANDALVADAATAAVSVRQPDGGAGWPAHDGGFQPGEKDPDGSLAREQ